MQAVGAQPAIAEFTRRVADSGRGVFLLDYDGTLAPFAARTADVKPYPGVAGLLDSLLDTERARLVVVTGRSLKDAMPRLDTRSRLEMWGSHGRERLRPDGQYSVLAIDDRTAAALAQADSWSTRIEAEGGYAEAKPGRRSRRAARMA